VAFIDLKRKEIQIKLVYYGPGRGGKTTNVLHLHNTMAKQLLGKMVTIDTKGDRTLFFDFLPVALGKVMDYSIRIQIYTVPGQVAYNDMRRLVLQGADGLVFVADSLRVQQQQNIISLRNLAENLSSQGRSLCDVPMVLQYNKRDLENTNIPILTAEELAHDLNRELQLPAFAASALKGQGVYETLREVCKRMVRQVSQKLPAM
jgi:hypothetical protein